ncbi:hypothetical protein PLESTB_001471500 [Pleodorina starrii]|uniref:Uncharacterized protein n=1 Tax=Pleodorina starrii TaxID=330485 RepID=A0A9W6F879_9CHLO|nr:hypothetical protein PLESTM_000642600 [Pleodorina starrii]GLC59296.1 hypothetical protein PLESTB_001471500 [Pleodorina starrii]GLC74505.1 hypothetical protein PLESTF_001519800 [Pleodorina starrii]
MVVLQGGSQQLDMRIKLLGQRRDLQDARAESVAEQIVRQCNRLGYDAATGRGRGGGAAAGLLLKGVSLDVARKKTKRVFEGGFRVAATGRTLRLKLSVVEVEEHDSGDTHTEITGSVPELDAALAQLLQQKVAPGGGGGGRGSKASGDDDGDGGWCGSGWAAEALQGLEELLRGLNSALESKTEAE